ncbi:hypothetical protein D7030_00165 [Flavobacteriaceae bacterium AU392]|nr:hypothetical protein D1817_14270 [Flavobacteriaceae bacterium]RKM86948.1 hypothetical protein D7030_00165 [Flavobacteriaceae bacterium AU392]
MLMLWRGLSLFVHWVYQYLLDGKLQFHAYLFNNLHFGTGWFKFYPMKTNSLKTLLFYFLVLLSFVSCSSNDDNSHQSSLSESLANTQWVFNHYEFIQETTTSEDLQNPIYGEIGVDFSVDEVENRTEVYWKDFVITFNDDNTGTTQDFTHLSDNQMHPMEWSLIDGSKIRIIYQIFDQLDPDTADTHIIILENVNLVVNTFTYEQEYLTHVGGGLYSKHYGRYIFD